MLDTARSVFRMCSRISACRASTPEDCQEVALPAHRDMALHHDCGEQIMTVRIPVGSPGLLPDA